MGNVRLDSGIKFGSKFHLKKKENFPTKVESYLRFHHFLLVYREEC